MKPYPLFVIGLEERRCVVIGGGPEAEYKVEGLLACDASVTLIAAEVTETLERHAEKGRLGWIQRDYQCGDLRAAFLVIATPAGPETNARIYREAEEEGALVNVMDDTKHCNFIAGSVVRRGPLVVSISTSGCAPALAVRLRERFEREFGPEYADFLELLAELRDPLAGAVPDFEQRRALWYRLVDSDVLDLLRAGQRQRARDRAGEIVSRIADLSTA